MQLNSPCCHASIEDGSHTEYPLGGSAWGINYIVPICSECSNLVEQPVECCDHCGEEALEYIECEVGDVCRPCFKILLDEAAEKLAEKWGLQSA